MRSGLGLGLDLGRSAVVTWPVQGVNVPCVADWRVDRGLTTSMGLVTSWADQSGYGSTLTVSSGDTAPAVIGGQLAGQPIVRFSGTERLTYARAQGVPVSVAFVARRQAGYSGWSALIRGDDYSGASFDGWEVDTSVPSGTVVNAWGSFHTGGPLYSSHALDDFSACVMSMSAYDNIAFYTDQHSADVVTVSGGNANFGRHVGGSSGSGDPGGHSDVAHIAMFDGALSATDAARVVEAMRALWRL